MTFENFVVGAVATHALLGSMHVQAFVRKCILDHFQISCGLGRADT